MNRKLVKHLPHYFSLLGILFFGGLGIILFSYDVKFQIALAVATACGYFAWGIVHHIIHKDLDLFVIIEYLTIAALGLIIVLSVIYRI